MNLKNKNVLYVIILISSTISILFGCTDKIEIATYTIDLSKAKNDESCCNFIKDISSIELETNDNCLIGFITNLHISNNKIYIMDAYITQSLFIFDISGRFISKINRVGKGPGEYLYLLDFVVDDSNRQILLLADANKIITVNMSGEFLREQTLKELRSNYLMTLNNDKYILGNHVMSGDDYQIYFTDKEFVSQKKYCPKYDGYENIAITKIVNYSGYNNNYLFNPPLSPIIYAIDENGCFPKYEFSIEEQFKLTNNKLLAFKQRNLPEIVNRTKYYLSVSSFFDLEKKLFVTFSLKQKKYWGMYNQENREFSCIDESQLKKTFGIDYQSVYFLSKLDEKTIIGFMLQEQEAASTADELNPNIIICKID